MKEIFISLVLDNLLPIQVILPLFCAIILIFFKQPKISIFFTQIYLLLGFSISIIIFFTIINTNLQVVTYVFGGFSPTVGIEYKLSKFTSIFLILISFMALISYIWGKNFLTLEVGANKVYFFNILYLIFYGGLLGMSLTNDLFNLFVFTEIMSLSSYAIISLNKNSLSSPFTTFNYLIISSVGTSLYVLGVGIVYMLVGSLNIEIIINTLSHTTFNPAIIAALVLFILFTLIKVGIFPFSVWVAKVYSDSPATFNPFMSSLTSKIILITYVEIIIIFVNHLHNPSNIITMLNFIAIGTIIIAAIIAIFQTNLRSMLAWSSVSYIGYIFLIIFESNKAILTASIVLIIWHSITKGGLFMVAGNINYLLGNTHLNNFGGIYKKSMFNFIAFIILSLSLIGFPGTLGFAVKWYLIVNLIHQKAIISTIAVLLASSISIFYIWQVIEKSIFNKEVPLAPDISSKKLPLSANIILGILIFSTLVLGIFGTYFIDFLYNISTVIVSAY